MSAGRLVAIDETNWRAALNVRVSDAQLPMVADSQPVALVILAKAYVRPGGRRWEPLAYVDAAGSVVAVLALTHVDGNPGTDTDTDTDTGNGSGDGVVEVRNFAVDVDRQGTGVGSSVMHAVFERCRANGSSSVEVTFHPANDVAARLYASVGFRPTGATRDDEPVWSISLDQR